MEATEYNTLGVIYVFEGRVWLDVVEIYSQKPVLLDFVTGAATTTEQRAEMLEKFAAARDSGAAARRWQMNQKRLRDIEPPVDGEANEQTVNAPPEPEP